MKDEGAVRWSGNPGDHQIRNKPIPRFGLRLSRQSALPCEKCFPTDLAQRRLTPNKPKNLRTIPGATFGGPIKKEELFFFGSWAGMFERVIKVVNLDFRFGLRITF